MPLAHLLAPQIARKVAEIETALGRPPSMPPPSGGYLTVGYEKTPYDPRGLMNKPEPKTFDPQAAGSGGGMQQALGAFQRSGDPGQRAFAKGAFLGMDDKFMKGYVQRPYTPPAPAPQPSRHAVPKKPGKAGKPGPNALVFAPGEQIGVTESGQPIYNERPKTWSEVYSDPKNDPRKLRVKPGQAIGVDENGQSVDIRGKKLGYLNQPAMVTPYGDVPIRTGERNAGDIAEADRDPFAMSVIEKKYGKHLDEVEFNNGKFPPGYFKGMKPEEKENIQKGVQLLIKHRREEKKGMPMV